MSLCVVTVKFGHFIEVDVMLIFGDEYGKAGWLDVVQDDWMYVFQESGCTRIGFNVNSTPRHVICVICVFCPLCNCLFLFRFDLYLYLDLY